MLEEKTLSIYLLDLEEMVGLECWWTGFFLPGRSQS